MLARTTLLHVVTLVALAACHAGGGPGTQGGRSRGLGDTGPLSMGERAEVACYSEASGKACFDAGKHFQVPDPERALVLYRRGCELGQLDACTAVGFLAERNGRLEEAFDLYETSCKGGEPIACGNLGRAMQSRGWNPEKAERLINQSQHMQEERCHNGDAYQCWELATDLDDQAQGDPGVAAERLSLLEKSCAGESWLGCWELGDTLMEGQSPADKARGKQVLDRMCDDGHGNSCERVAEVLEQSPATRADAAPYYSRACGFGNKSGCYNDCSNLRDAHKLEQARAQCSRGCNLGEESACATYGVMLDNGEGGPADPFRAAAVLERGCDLGKATACRNFGIMLEDGRGVEKDPRRALQMYDNACENQDSEACDRRDALRDSIGDEGEPYDGMDEDF